MLNRQRICVSSHRRRPAQRHLLSSSLVLISSCVSSRVSLPPTMTWESTSQETTPAGSSTPNQESAVASATTTCCQCITHTCRGTACPLSGPPALETRVCIPEEQPLPVNLMRCVTLCSRVCVSAGLMGSELSSTVVANVGMSANATVSV